MPVSSTFSTSAPKSARRSEQKPPGSRRLRSRTLTSASGGFLGGGALTLGDSQELAGLDDGGGSAADVLCHLARFRDQLAIGLRHLPIRQVEVVLDAGANVAAESQGRAEQLPLVARYPDRLPLVPPLRAARNLLGH